MFPQRDQINTEIRIAEIAKEKESAGCKVRVVGKITSELTIYESQ